MSEERLRKDINRLKRLTNGCMSEYHQDIEDVLDRLEQYKSVLDEIREQLKFERKIALSLNKPYTVSVIDKLLDKVKE